MPTRRTRVPRERVEDALSVEAVAAWKAGDFHALGRALNIAPWQVSPFDAVGKLPDWAGPSSAVSQSWDRAVALRQALLEAGGKPGRMDRHGQPLGPRR